MSEALPVHHRQDGADAVEHALDVDVDHPVPFVELERGHGRKRHDAGIVDHDVDPPPLGVGGLGEGMNLLPAGDVETPGDRFAPGRVDFAGERFEPIEAPGAQHDFCAGTAELARDALADAAAGAGDQNDLVERHCPLLGC